MTALTNEIIGLVLLTAAIAIVVVVRHRMSRARRPKGPLGAATRRPGASQATGRSLESAASVTSAFGPAPVWAGGPTGVKTADRAGSGDPVPPSDQGVPPRAEAGPQPRVEVIAVPGNSTHASRVMHVSNLRDPVAREIPTAWMVVTPMDLLGGQPPEFRSLQGDSHSADEMAAPAPPPDQEQCAVQVPEYFPGRLAESAAAPLCESQVAEAVQDVIMVSPNPFAPTGTDLSSPTDLGMPSSLLADLLGFEDPTDSVPRS